MAGETLEIDTILAPNKYACDIANRYQTWENFRQPRVAEWREIQQYIFATDTSKTSNSKLPWSNKTTLPKLCQIRDNLFSNYMASMFPKRKWMKWEGDTQADEDINKRKAIESYMTWVVDRNEFYDEVSKLVLDYIDYGQCFAMPEWKDGTNDASDGEPPKIQAGYVGPVLRRISPLDIVFNPTAPDFASSPKIIRSLVTIGEVKDMLDKTPDPDERVDARKVWEYMNEIRNTVGQYAPGSAFTKDNIYNIAGFDSYQNYLGSNYAEILTFYGDLYNIEEQKLYKNQVIQIIDRDQIISQRSNPSLFGTSPIYTVGWRVRPDNLWCMGPLDNLVGMQYRIDHLENLKADCFDLTATPMLKIKGYVEDFNWEPFGRIYVGDDGDVDILQVPVQASQADNQIANLTAAMEEMAGSPKEAMGFRTPGEKTAYEVQRLENASSRVFQNKISQFERQMTENLLNAMLELARRKVSAQTIRVFNDELKFASFLSLTSDDLVGAGRIKPVAARHYAEVATKVQNATNFFGSAAGQDPMVLQHFSSVALAKMWNELLDLDQFNIVMPNIRVAEAADTQRLMQSAQEQVGVEQQTAGGIMQGDHDPELNGLELEPEEEEPVQ